MFSAALTGSLAVEFYPVFGPPPAAQDEAGVRGTLSGTVSLSGTLRPLPGAVVTATSFLQTLTATADAQGNYQLAGICADVYRLRAGAPGFPPSAEATARLRWPGDTVETDLFLVSPFVEEVYLPLVWRGVP